MDIQFLTDWHLLRFATGGMLIVLFLVFCAVVASVRSASRRRSHAASQAVPSRQSFVRVEHA